MCFHPQRQGVVYLLHPEGLDITNWLALFGTAFALKTIQIVHMIIMQCTADIFLIDWERPKGLISSGDAKKKEAPVSIWRTYFVANEWNEIQTIRKINQIFQIFASVFFLSYVGFENAATKDPNGNLVKSDSEYQAAQSQIFRFGIAVTVYIVIGEQVLVFLGVG